MTMPGRNYSSNLYRYGFNSHEKSNEITGEGNHTTALFGEYDTRLGRRWNLDPKPSSDLSNYSVFQNNPILLNDVLLDTPRIYGNAEVTNTTLTDKGGTADLGTNSFKINDAKLVPAINPKNKKMIGYHIYDTKNNDRNLPIMQIEPGDLQAFKDNYVNYMAGARIYYSNGEPTEGMKKISASLESVDLKLAWAGVKQENKDAWSNPVFVAQMVLSLAHAGAKTLDRSSLYAPNREQNRIVKYRYVGMSNVTGGRSGGKSPLLGSPNSYTITRGGHMIFYQANGRALWDVSKDRIKVWNWNNGFAKDGGYVTNEVPDLLKRMIDASKKK